MFTEEEFKGKFKEIKGEIKKKWGEITDDELTRTKGNGQALFGVIQQKFGAKKAELEEHFKALKARWFHQAKTGKRDFADGVNGGIDQAKDTVKRK